jgi:hypothetical protein
MFSFVVSYVFGLRYFYAGTERKVSFPAIQGLSYALTFDFVSLCLAELVMAVLKTL